MTTVIATTFEGERAVSEDNLLTLLKRGWVAIWQEDGRGKFTFLDKIDVFHTCAFIILGFA